MLFLNLLNIKRLVHYVGPTEGIKPTDKNYTLEYYSVGSSNSEVGYRRSIEYSKEFQTTSYGNVVECMGQFESVV